MRFANVLMSQSSRFHAFQKIWAERPLFLILWLGIILRLFAAVFSQGYAFHSDHFLIIEPAQSWVVSEDYRNWLPWNQETPKPPGQSLFYSGAHFLFFYFLQNIGVLDPKVKMLIVRFLHGFFSMLIVFYSYVIANKFAGKKAANLVGLLMAVLWIMPFLSVRTIPEFVCIPFILSGYWKVLDAENENKQLALEFLLAGMITGLGFSIYYQSLIIILGLIIVLFMQNKWQETFYFMLGWIVSVLAIQGIVDFLIWNKPFAQLNEFIIHFQEHFINSNHHWFVFLIYLTALFFVFPFGFLYMFGFGVSIRKTFVLTFPVLFYLVFMLINKMQQNVSIYTILPFYTIAAVIGWQHWEAKSVFWQKYGIWLQRSKVAFWLINAVVLIFFTFSFTKKTSVETMSFLSLYRDDLHSIVIENSTREQTIEFPNFYLEKWVLTYSLTKKNNPDPSVFGSYELESPYIRRIYSLEIFKTMQPQEQPQFILFVNDKDLEARVERAKKVFPYLHAERDFQPSMADKIIQFINPNSGNFPVFVYRTALENQD